MTLTTGPDTIDACELIVTNLGTPAAMMEMLPHSRPGPVEPLPALPDARHASGFARRTAVRGSFEADPRPRDGAPLAVPGTPKEFAR